MTNLITPTTELEAVNECLSNIGQAPVSSISGDIGVDAQIALGHVRSTNRELQSAGWFWNTDREAPLTPNIDKNIILPVNTLSVRSDGRDAHRSFTQRGALLYDRDKRTFVFDRPVLVEITVGLPFDELPEPARRFVALRAARIFQDRTEGESSVDDARDEMTAYATLHAEQIRNENNNARSDSYSMELILNRTRF